MLYILKDSLIFGNIFLCVLFNNELDEIEKYNNRAVMTITWKIYLSHIDAIYQCNWHVETSWL